MYAELARWFHLITAPAEYAEAEAGVVNWIGVGQEQLIAQYSR